MITMTSSAAEKIKEILEVEGLAGHGFRITATAGGCCGPQYEISIDDKPGAGDAVVEKDGSRLFIDAATAKALDGAEFGYIKDAHEEGFVLSFPNSDISGGCGCGPAESAGRCGCA